MNAHAKFHCAPMCIKKDLGIYRELITKTNKQQQQQQQQQPE